MAWTDIPVYAAGRFTVAMAELVRGNLKEIGDPWTSYVPVLTASTTPPNLGSTGTIVGEYVEAGKSTWGHVRITFAGTGVSGGSGVYAVTVPLAAAGTAVPRAAGSCAFERAGTVFARTPFFVNSTSLGMADGLGNRLGSTTAWAAGDEIDIEFRYEAI